MIIQFSLPSFQSPPTWQYLWDRTKAICAQIWHWIVQCFTCSNSVYFQYHKTTFSRETPMSQAVLVREQNIVKRYLKEHTQESTMHFDLRIATKLTIDKLADVVKIFASDYNDNASKTIEWKTYYVYKTKIVDISSTPSHALHHPEILPQSSSYKISVQFKLVIQTHHCLHLLKRYISFC